MSWTYDDDPLYEQALSRAEWIRGILILFALFALAGFLGWF